jgi:hypothetical protein
MHRLEQEMRRQGRASCTQQELEIGTLEQGMHTQGTKACRIHSCLAAAVPLLLPPKGG